jgi:hypothetical protein
MATGRQIELRTGSTTLALNDATYILQADGGWASLDSRLSIKLLVKPTVLTQLERLVTPIERMLTAADLYEQSLIGSPVYVCTKTCDDLSTTAEIGATWLRKRVYGGQLRIVPLSGTAATPQAYLVVELAVDELWQRISPAPIIEVTSGSATVRATDGAIQTSGAASLYVRRLLWTTSTGVTARVLWEYADTGTAQINFIRMSGDMRVFWGGTGKQFAIGDDAGTYHYSGVYTFTAGQQIEIVARWTTTSLSVYVNGVQAIKQSGTFSLTAPDTYRIWEPDSGAGAQTLLSVQVWPTTLTDIQCTGLASWGRPEPHLAFTTVPSDDKATNAVYKIYNVPGHASARVRAILHSVGSQDYSQVRVGVRPLRIPSTVKFECESGTLGSATASNSNSDASGGSQARFTPTDTAYATRVTITLAANPADVAALQGAHRLFLAGYDGASAVNVNLLQWRIVVAGQAGTWSDELGFGAVATRSLLDLGELSIPADGWPEETIAATTTGYGSAYVTLELQAKNTVGSGGGTLDLDAVYLAPAEVEGLASAVFDVSDVDLLLDFATEPPAALLIQDGRSLEYGGPAAWQGDDLVLAPAAGASGLVWLAWYRDASEKLYPNDTCDVWLLYAARWRCV